MWRQKIDFFLILIVLCVTISVVVGFSDSIEERFEKRKKEFDRGWERSKIEHEKFSKSFNKELEWMTRERRDLEEENDRASKLWGKISIPVAIAVAVCVILCIVCSWCRGNCDADDEERGYSRESSDARIRLVFNENQDSYIYNRRLARLAENDEWRTSSNYQRPTYGSHSSPPSNSTPYMIQYPTSSYYPSAPLQTVHQVPPIEYSNNFSTDAEGYSAFSKPSNNKGNSSNLLQQEPYNPNFNPNYRPTYEDPPPPYPGNI